MKCTVIIRDLLIHVRTRFTGNGLEGPNLSEYLGGGGDEEQGNLHTGPKFLN
jgi:hypothetical protein